MAIKFAFCIVVWLLGCTCCCEEDAESVLAGVARTAAEHVDGAATTELEKGSEHSKHLDAFSSTKQDELLVSPTMEVITQNIDLGSTCSNVNQNGLGSSLPAADIVTADEKPREATYTFESDQAVPAGASPDQGSDQTNETKHAEDVVVDSTTEAYSRSEEPVLPETKQDQEAQHPSDATAEAPVVETQDEAVEGSPESDVVKLSELPDGMPKKEGDEGAEHDRKESAEKMPTFVEWKQKMLAEHEKGGELPPEVKGTPAKKKASGSKSRRNYASYECGAKVLATNAEADGAGRVLNEQMDEYMLNPCKAKIWFVIELCEMIQVSQVDIANFELFSSMPKEFAVMMSDRYPTRDWTPLGTFTAQDHKVVQSFGLHSEAYGKYIKVELLSRYGSEHYCPLSLVRVFGTSMIDDYEQLVEKPQDPSAQDDDEEEASTEGSPSKNVVDRAKDVVISLFKVLRRDQDGAAGNSIASAPCSDLDANCSIVNASHQGHNATAVQLGCHQNRSQRFFGSVFQSCTMCSLFVGQSKVAQSLSETIACQFLRAALSLGESCPINEPEKEPEVADIPRDFNDSDLKTESSDVFSATSQSTETASSVLAKTTQPSAPTGNATTQVEASRVLVSNSSDAAPSPSAEFLSSTAGTATASTSEVSSEAVDQSHWDNGTVLESFDGGSESAQTENATPQMSVDTVPLQSSSIGSDTTADSVTATPVILDVPTSVKTSPSSSSTVDVEISSPVVDSSLPKGATTVSGAPPTEIDSGPQPPQLLVIEPGTEGGDLLTTVPLPMDELVPETDLQLRGGEVGVRAPPPEAGALALASSQRESVFMRINNRIKALELNMSLSGQYLEELSRRYRRQMDDMQRAFNRTVNALNKTAQKAAEKDLRQQETLVQLQQQLDNLTQVVNTLLVERQALSKQVFESHLCLIVIEVIILATVFSLCLRRMRGPPTMVAQQQEAAARPVTPGRLVLKRRTASVGPEERIEELTTVAEKKQKPSDEMLATPTSSKFVIVEPTPPIVVEAAETPKEKTKKVNKHKKHKGPRRKSSLPCYSSSEPGSSRPKEPAIPESNAGVLFSSREAARGPPPAPRAAAPRAAVVAAPKGTGAGAQRFPKGGSENRGAQNGALRSNALRPPADCIRWSGQSCCDKDDRIGLIKFLRIPGKTPV